MTQSGTQQSYQKQSGLLSAPHRQRTQGIDNGGGVGYSSVVPGGNLQHHRQPNFFCFLSQSEPGAA